MLELSELVSTFSTRDTAAFHLVLKFHLFRGAQVWHAHCLNGMGRRSHRSVRLLPPSGHAKKKFSGQPVA